MKNFTVTGMSCAACASRVEKSVSSLEGVDSCSVNPITGLLSVEGDVDDVLVISAVTGAGYGILTEKTSESGGKNVLLKKDVSERLTGLIVSLILLMPIMYLGMGHDIFSLPLPSFFVTYGFISPLVSMILCLAVMAVNRRFFISGAKAVLKFSPNMDTLVSLGSFFSFVYGAAVFCLKYIFSANVNEKYYFESAAMILVFVSVGKLLEARGKVKTGDALESLSKLAPSEATLIVNGKEITVQASSLKPGDIFAVRPGERFPADGIVTEGFGSADESAFTGESVPAEKQPGSKVLTACVNLTGYLVCRAEKTGSDTAISAVVKAAETAASSKAPVSRAADRISAVLVPCVMFFSFITAIIWLIAGKSFSFALEKAVSVLVITCPCSLGLATPAAITAAGGIGAKHGILFKSAESIEVLSSVGKIFFDKTGTLTKGTPEVTDILPAEGYTENEVLTYAYALEFKSEHPLAKAIAEKASSGNFELKETADFRYLPGSGVSAVSDDSLLTGGNYEFISASVKIPENIVKISEELKKQGKTTLFFAKDGKFLCMIAERDSLKENAFKIAEEFSNLGAETVLLSGDSEETVKAIAAEAGIKEYFGGISPSGKAEIISAASENFKTAMVGDGINDAAALTSAHCGIAIGTGADIAVDSADIVLMGKNIEDAVTALRLSQKTMKIIKENLFWAFFYNIICIPLAAGAFIPLLGISLSPMYCALCMSVSSFCVVANSLRLNYIFRTKTVKETKKEKKQMKITLKVDGMMCTHCEARVKKALESLPYVVSAEPSHEKGNVLIEVSEDGHENDLKKCIENQGYTVL